jgi:hypothetical protein
MKRIYTTPQTPTRGQTLGRTVSDCGAYGIAEQMDERKKSERGCARLLDLLRQAHGESRPDLVPVRVRAMALRVRQV